MKLKINFLFLARIAIGLVLCLSGFIKLTEPYQNFLYDIQQYSLFSSGVETFIAQTVPWVEFFVGVFLLLGLWIRVIVPCAFLIFVSFVLIILQALLKGISLDSCGCFGEMIAVPSRVMMLFDLVVCVFLFLMIRCYERTSVLSLDRWLSQGGE